MKTPDKKQWLFFAYMTGISIIISVFIGIKPAIWIFGIILLSSIVLNAEEVNTKLKSLTNTLIS